VSEQKHLEMNKHSFRSQHHPGVRKK